MSLSSMVLDFIAGSGGDVTFETIEAAHHGWAWWIVERAVKDLYAAGKIVVSSITDDGDAAFSIAKDA